MMLLATSNGAKIGALSGLNIWDLSPFGVFLFLLAIDFGMIIMLMALMERPRGLNRHYFPSFIINDILIIPLFGAMTRLIVGDEDPRIDWLASRSWIHWGALAAGYLLSIGLEVAAVSGGVFTLREEVSPSKLWHTLVFGVMGYWLIIGALVVGNDLYWGIGRGFGPSWASLVAVVLFILWLVVVFYVDPQKGPNQKLPSQKVHFEWQ